MAINPKFITYPITTDSQTLIDNVINYLKIKIPGWQPSEGQLAMWLTEAISGEAADIGTLTTEVPKSIYRDFGARRFGIPPVDASSATTTATVNLTDSLGHIIPAGLQVGIYDTFGVLQPFTVLSDVGVGAGDSSGVVTLVAVNPGSAASGIGSVSGPITLIDTITWIDTIVQIAVTTGGADAESDDQYLDRLTLFLQTMTPTPILPKDFAILARSVAGVQRATAIDGYNPDDMSTGNERMVCVVSLDANGAGVDSGHKTAVGDYLETLRETNFEVKTADPTVNNIDVSTQISILPGYAPTDVVARVTDAINNYLDPSLWGIDPTDDPSAPKTWDNNTTIYYLELAYVIGNVTGVDKVLLLTLNIHGDPPGTVDLSLTGIAPLPSVDVLSVVAV